MSEECLRMLIEALVMFSSYETQKIVNRYFEKSST